MEYNDFGDIQTPSEVFESVFDLGFCQQTSWPVVNYSGS